ncbi:MAG TPA: two-component regulator propeller domain-containing protein, partial [bacterium]
MPRALEVRGTSLKHKTYMNRNNFRENTSLLSSEVKFSFARFFFFFVSISCLANHLNAQPQNISFECLTLDQGLSQSTVATIVQDDDGFMWFGTIDGLNKFDGYNFTVYKNNPSDSGSIADNWITSLCLGKDGTLWIGTLSRGLCNYDPRSDRFSNYRFNPSPIDSPERQRLLAELPFTFSYLNYFTIKAIFEDHTGSLWIGTFGGGLYQFDKKTGEFIHYPFIFEAKNDLAYNIMTINETVQDGVSTLWLGTYGGGLVKFKPGEVFTCYKHDPANSNSLVNNRIISICPDTCCGKQFLWIGTFGGGMDRFDLTSGEFTHYQHDPQNSNSLSSNQIMSILKDCCNELWIGTFNAGLNRLEINNNQFTRYQHDPTNINSLGSNEVLALFEDRTGILWIGTNFGYGINKFNRRKNKFTHYFHDPQDAKSLSENVVFSLFEDRDGFLWIGAFQTGINRFDREKNEFISFRHDPKKPFSISDNHVRAIFEDSRGALWIGTFSGGLNYFDRKNN